MRTQLLGCGYDIVAILCKKSVAVIPINNTCVMCAIEVKVSTTSDVNKLVIFLVQCLLSFCRCQFGTIRIYDLEIHVSQQLWLWETSMPTWALFLAPAAETQAHKSQGNFIEAIEIIMLFVSSHSHLWSTIYFSQWSLHHHEPSPVWYPNHIKGTQWPSSQYLWPSTSALSNPTVSKCNIN